jgi:phage terminase large subunit
MTYSKSFAAKRRVGRQSKGAQWACRTSFADSLLEDLRALQTASAHVRFPSAKYRADPVAFFREILGVEPWSRQIEIIEAVRDHPRVAVSSGHKVSKSHTAAGIALWYYCSFDDARVVMTSTTSRQVDQILWRELRMMRARGGRCTACCKADPEMRRIERPCPHSAVIEGEQGDMARTGLKSPDFREIVGFTAREAEAVAGISGANLLYLVDEASGVTDEIFEAIEGNRAGGARIVMFSNPTRNEGEFYEAFHEKSQHYHSIRVSSEETPNVVTGKIVIPGLATREWIEEKRDEWGENSSLYRVRIRGEHAVHEEGRIFSVHAISAAEARWSETPEAGRLFVGVDPAGESGSGDETAFSVRRGLKQLLLKTMRGLNDEQHLVQILAMLSTWRLPREVPVVVLDRDGSIGSKLYLAMRNHAEAHPSAYELVACRASDKAIRNPQLYDRVRDELAANLEQWMRDGGAIVEDAKLEKDLHALEWKQAINGKLKLTPKDTLRKTLGRSPDRYDALALSVWEPLNLSDHVPESAAVQAAREHDAGPRLDPYAAGDTWR